MRKSYLALPALVLLVLSVTADSNAGNWPRFRGPNGVGVASDSGIPVEFSDTQNVLWKTAIPGAGNSSPIVWGDRVFLETAPDDNTRALVCLDAASGKVIWSKTVGGNKAKTHKKNTAASSTPATDGERVYASFWDGENVFLHAYDFQGKSLWERNLGGFKSQHGAGGSPIVWQDKIFFNFDQDGAAAILAFDAKTGTPLWEKKREAFRTCYSTPFIQEVPNVSAELIVTSTAGITSYNPQTGDENWKWVWKFAGIMPQRTVGSAIAHNGLIFAASGDGSGTRHMVAVKPGTDASLLWENKKSFPYVPTMLARGQHLYFVNDNGVAACHVAQTGEEVWKERLGGGVSASPLMIDGKVYAACEDGTVYVFAAETTYKLLARNKIGETLMATPAVADNRLYVRGQEHLFCIGKKAK
jgi:outer membrane protein assembly factor BamB